MRLTCDWLPDYLALKSLAELASLLEAQQQCLSVSTMVQLQVVAEIVMGNEAYHCRLNFFPQFER